MSTPHVPAYRDFIPLTLLERLIEEAEPVDGVPGMRVAPGLRGDFPAIEADEALAFAAELYRRTGAHLATVLEQRKRDRDFVDRVTASLQDDNEGVDYGAEAYRTVIGHADAAGRVVVGPAPEALASRAPVDVPDFLQGEQVTLFGPPDTAKMSINAMNALHRRRPDEPPLVTELVEAAGAVPRWGADNEDSKTPIMHNFLAACANLIGCYEGTLRFEDEARGKRYELADHDLSIPIKRIPGLALPDGSHLLDREPLPLHLFDFATHLFHNRERPEALVFYVPKLENEEEAAYLAALITEAESMLQALGGGYEPGTVRLFVVFENPRAIFRIAEMAEALSPWFVGGSLGWHDFLASTARLFRRDPSYRIPVKADPNIVINHIKESHLILVRAMAPIGGIAIGGMYGVLFEAGSAASYAVSMVGYVKDVVTQLRRGLDGFWVAHPDFVRVGIALVEAFRRGQRGGEDDTLRRLIEALVPDPVDREPLMAFVEGADVPGLAEDDPRYERAVLAADVQTSDVIANDHPDEVRYNIFQALQYLTDWLCGNGCVALPATMTNARGEEVFVRVMDDLATTERSRWELWAEVNHGRVPVETFDALLQEQVAFIRGGGVSDDKRVQVRWEGEAARWYPTAARLLRRLVVDPEPVEFVTELLLPFTFEPIRASEDPWEAAAELCPGRFST